MVKLPTTFKQEIKNMLEETRSEVDDLIGQQLAQSPDLEEPM